MSTLATELARSALPSNVVLRTCIVDGSSMISIVDMISAVCECTPDNAIAKWKRFKEVPEHADLVSASKLHTFSRTPCPVADAKTALAIAFALPGHRAAAFRRSGAWTMMKCFDPDDEFAEQIVERMEQLRCTSNAFASTSENAMTNVAPWELGGLCNVQINHRVHQETTVYVRVRLPGEYVRPVLNPKSLTLRRIKFGIAYNLNNRNGDYARDPDNGFMMYSIVCPTRSIAVAVENIIKYRFEHAAVLNSREYIDVAKVAVHFGMSDPGDDYNAYLSVATRLFVDIEHTIKINLPTTDHTAPYGYVYEPRGCDNMLDFKNKAIVVELAAEMGMESARSALTSASPSAPASPSPPASPSTSAATQSPVEKTPSRRSNGPVIARDVLTGVETTYASAEAAESGCIQLRALAVTANVLKDNYVDRKRQVGGFTWRSTEFNPTRHWVPPSGFVFDPTLRNTGSSPMYVAGALSAPRPVRIVYDFCKLAAKVNQEDWRDFRSIVEAGQTRNGIKWSKLDYADAGRWSDKPLLPEELDSTYVTPTTVCAPSAKVDASGANGRTFGRVIARNLATGEDLFFPSSESARIHFKITAKAVRGTFLDKARQVRGHCLRSFASRRVWSPPAYLVYDPASWERVEDGHVMRMSLDGSILAMYENLKTAAAADGGGSAMSQMISTRINTGKACPKGYLWRRAKPEEVETFVDVAPVAGGMTSSSDGGEADGNVARAGDDNERDDDGEVDDDIDRE